VTHRHVRPVEAGAAVTASPNGDVGHKLRVIRDMVLPTRHSELGRPTKELVKFSRSHWQKHFLEHGFELVEVAPMGLFYTGNIVLAEHLTFPARERLSHVLGSSCVLYRVRPSPRV
jgi:hypothetical protein